MTTTPEPTRTSAIKIAIAVIPALLILSICIALYLGATAEEEESEPLIGEVTVPEMADYLKKLDTMISERDVTTESGQRALRQVAAMSLGTLGPENLGYEIFKTQIDSASGLLWPTIWINAGDRESKNPVVIALPQDGAGTAVAFAYGFAEYLTSHETKKGVRLVLYPPLAEGDLKEWIWERCGGEGEEMAGFLAITEGNEDTLMSGFSFPEEKRAFAESMTDAGFPDQELVSSLSRYPELRIELVGKKRLSHEGHAQKLIRLMPFVKDLVESLIPKR
ncbi:MAG: hypothetical protein ACI8UZ_001077 [Akkermansiaceae bacterium]|jgi:hypothetical protein